MDLQKTRFNDANREEIQYYLAEGGKSSGVELSAKQLQILERWRYADERIRENKYTREQIAKFIMGKFDVCRDTAYRDIVNAEHVFASTAPLNKKYITQRRIEFLEKKINDCYIKGETMIAAMLEKVLQKYIEKYPDALLPHSPKTIIYKIVQNNVTVNQDAIVQEAEEAFGKTDEILKRLEDKSDE